jgi:hypothetical protein
MRAAESGGTPRRPGEKHSILKKNTGNLNIISTDYPRRRHEP